LAPVEVASARAVAFFEDDSTMGTHQELQWAKRKADRPVRVARKVDLKVREAGFRRLVMATRTFDGLRGHHLTWITPAMDSYQLASEMDRDTTSTCKRRTWISSVRINKRSLGDESERRKGTTRTNQDSRRPERRSGNAQPDAERLLVHRRHAAHPAHTSTASWRHGWGLHLGCGNYIVDSQ
jgi:hypothetical protein